MDKYEVFIILCFTCSVRVANELGRGSARAAKFSIWVTVITSFVIGFVLFIFFLFFRGRLAYIFTESPAVAKEVDHLSPLLAFSLLLNSVQPVLSGKLIMFLQWLFTNNLYLSLFTYKYLFISSIQFSIHWFYQIVNTQYSAKQKVKFFISN